MLLLVKLVKLGNRGMIRMISGCPNIMIQFGRGHAPLGGWKAGEHIMV